MFNYARSDTHFLLYVYDHMRNELIEKSESLSDDGNLIDIVLRESKKVASRKYEREFYDAERGMGSAGWYGMLFRIPALFTKEQFAIFRAVHQWRDETARQYDESLHFIMPKNVIFNLAREMPTELPALLGCSHPISQLMHQHAGELLAVVRGAKASGSTGPDFKDFMKPQSAQNEEPSNKVAIRKEQSTMISSKMLEMSRFTVGQTVAAVRSRTSSFWGSIIPGVESKHSQSTLQQTDLRLALPLPQLTADIFGRAEAEYSQDTAAPLPEPGSRADHKFVKDRPVVDDDVFVIKGLGHPRKRKGSDLQKDAEPVFNNGRNHMSIVAIRSDNTTEMTPSNNGQEWSIQEQAQRMAKQKETKKLKKLAKRLEKESGHGNGKEAEQPFDYTKAPSVLYAKPEKDAGRRVKPAFDPYSKSLDAPKGAGKSTKEIAGKSFTFKK